MKKRKFHVPYYVPLPGMKLDDTAHYIDETEPILIVDCSDKIVTKIYHCGRIGVMYNYWFVDVDELLERIV